MGTQTEAAAQMGLNFDQAVEYVRREQGTAFAFTPIFEEDDEAATGGQLFVLVPEGISYYLRFVAGPFFYKVYVEDEAFEPNEIPDLARNMRFWPSAWREDIFELQLQDILRFLMENKR